MKKLTVFLLIAVLLAMPFCGIACEPQETGGKTLFSNMGNAIITIDGEKHTFANSYTANVYTEFQKKTYIEENYDAVSFYLQMAPDAPADNTEDWVRCIFNRLTGPGVNVDDAANRLYQSGASYKLYNGDDAIHVTLPFKYTDKEGVEQYFNNFYIIFTNANNDGKFNMIMADLKFIKYVEGPPTATVTDTDVTSHDGEVCSNIMLEFSQTMNPDTFVPENFTIGGEPVKAVTLDESGKKAELICNGLMEFETEYELAISENVNNLCDNCSYAVADDSRNFTVVFKTPEAIKIGTGKFTNELSETLTEMAAGKNTYTVPVQNKFDLTEGGRHFTLITTMYVNNELKRIYYDECTLLPGESKDLSRTVTVTEKNAPNTEIQAFLWDNPIDMNAFADMAVLKPSAAE